MRRTEYFVSFKTSVVLNEYSNAMVTSEELISTIEYITL